MSSSSCRQGVTAITGDQRPIRSHNVPERKMAANQAFAAFLGETRHHNPELTGCYAEASVLRVRKRFAVGTDLDLGPLIARLHVGFVRHERATLGQRLDLPDGAGPGESLETRPHGGGQ